MKTDFDEIIEALLKHEGGYINDPADPGGETKYGISKRAYPDVAIQNLTIDSAKAIYKRDYWQGCKVRKLNLHYRYIYFDMCVNQGKSRATKILQQACNAKGANLVVDGGLGPNTFKALEQYSPELERILCYRLKHYYDLVNKKPTLEKYIYGWVKRALEVLDD